VLSVSIARSVCIMDEIISVNNLDFAYDGGKKVLNGIDFKVRRGETFGIIGPTGAGKSTLLFHLNGILKGEGDIFVDGIRVSKKTDKEVRSKIGIVFQNPDNQLFCPTVEEDISFGLFNMGLEKEEVNRRVDRILERMNLVELKHLSSHHLSFGEKKRVSLASVLVMQPGIICFDEPFANLDYKSIFNLVQEIREMDITRLIVSQDVLLAFYLCDRIAVMNKGEVVKIAPTPDIIKDQALLKEIGIDYQLYLDMINSFHS